MCLSFVLSQEALHDSPQRKHNCDKLFQSFELSLLVFWGLDAVAAQVKRRGSPEQHLVLCILSPGRCIFSSLLCSQLFIFSLHFTSSAVKYQDSNAALLHGHPRRLRIIKAEPQSPARVGTPTDEFSLFLTLLWICSVNLVLSLYPCFFPVYIFCENGDGRVVHTLLCLMI